jgi:plastocyanin domain-containing protein
MKILSKNNLHHTLSFGALSKTYRNTPLSVALNDFMKLVKEYKETQRKAFKTAQTAQTVKTLFEAQTIDYLTQIKSR